MDMSYNCGVALKERLPSMNDRIRELSEQAEKYADDNFRGEPTWSEAFESKFAELIVRECIEQGKLIQSQTIVDGSEEYVAGYVAGREMGIEVFMNQIKKHFGIEV
jgi:hypothetical protein